jgi:hypothetical protein
MIYSMTVRSWVEIVVVSAFENDRTKHIAILVQAASISCIVVVTNAVFMLDLQAGMLPCTYEINYL